MFLALCYNTECFNNNVIALDSQLTCSYNTECSLVALVITRNSFIYNTKDFTYPMSNCYNDICAQGSSQAVITGNVMLVSSGYPSQLFLCSYHEFLLTIHLVDHCHSNVCAVSNPICTEVSLYPKYYPWSSQQ